ncbi:MAG: LytTR family transcriptional regulator DNA-binding domain-containing protein [Bacteroidota bacterium]
MLKINYLKLFLIFVTAFIPTILNRTELIDKIVSFNHRFYLDLFMAMVTAVILWELNRIINLYLNKKSPLERNIFKRLIYQVLLSMPVSISIVYVLYFFYSTYIVGIPLSDMIAPNGDLLVIILDILLINVYYIGSTFLNNWKNTNSKLEEFQKDKENKSAGNFLIVHSGSNAVTIYFDEVAEIFIESGSVFLLLFNNRQYLLSENLNYYSALLPETAFFRINRQLICHRKNISSYRYIENGKLEVRVITGKQGPVVSQKSSSKFRKWYKGTF